MPSRSAGRATSSSDCISGPKVQETGWRGSSGPTRICLRIGAFCMGMAEHREPYDARVSRTVLGARGGETPPRDSPSVPDDRRQEALALARGRPGWGCARRSGPEPAGQTGRQALAPQAADHVVDNVAQAASDFVLIVSCEELRLRGGRANAAGLKPSSRPGLARPVEEGGDNDPAAAQAWPTAQPRGGL